MMICTQCTYNTEFMRVKHFTYFCVIIYFVYYTHLSVLYITHTCYIVSNKRTIYLSGVGTHNGVIYVFTHIMHFICYICSKYWTYTCAAINFLKVGAKCLMTCVHFWVHDI